MFPREYVKLSGTYIVISPFFSLKENEDLKGVEAAKGTRGQAEASARAWVGADSDLSHSRTAPHSAQPKPAVRTVPGLHGSRLSVALRPALSLPPKSVWRRFLTPPQSEEPALRKFRAHALEGTGALSRRRRPRVRVLVPVDGSALRAADARGRSAQPGQSGGGPGAGHASLTPIHTQPTRDVSIWWRRGRQCLTQRRTVARDSSDGTQEFVRWSCTGYPVQFKTPNSPHPSPKAVLPKLPPCLNPHPYNLSVAQDQSSAHELTTYYPRTKH